MARGRGVGFGGWRRPGFRSLVRGSSKVVGEGGIATFLAGGRNLDPAVATMLGIDPTTGADLGSGAKFHLAGPIPAGSNPTIPFSKPDDENFDSGIGRLDHSIAKADKITLRYEFDRFTKAAVFNPLLLVAYTDATFSIVAQNALIHETHVFSPRLNQRLSVQ